MKILLATTRISIHGTGIPSYNYELNKALSNYHEIDLMTEADETDDEHYSNILSTYGHSPNDIDYSLKLIDRINWSNYDCIINSASSFIPIMAPFLKAPIISISHFVNGRLATNAGYNAKYLSRIVSLSKYGKDFLIRKFKIDTPEKVAIIYNSVEPVPILYPNKNDQRPLKIVYPGGTSVKKSVDVIQRLVYRLLSTDLDFEFIWIGGTVLPSSKYSLLNLQDTHDLFQKDPRLKIMGIVPREEAMRIISSANIFILPSRGEGCPMTLLEAMREGCIPIVSNAKHGSRELLEKANLGFIVEQDSSKDLFDCIKEIIDSPEKYEFFYDSSRNFLSAELSNETWIHEMNHLLEPLDTYGPRQYIKPTKSKYLKSLNGFKSLINHDRMLEMLNSMICRIRLDTSYIMNKARMYSK